MTSHVTAELTDGTGIRNVLEVVEGSNGVYLEKEIGGDVRRAADVPYPQLVSVRSEGRVRTV